MKGLEPPLLAKPEPKSGASTNSATSARRKEQYNTIVPNLKVIRSFSKIKRSIFYHLGRATIHRSLHFLPLFPIMTTKFFAVALLAAAAIVLPPTRSLRAESPLDRPVDLIAKGAAVERRDANLYYDRGIDKYQSGDKRGAMSDFDRAISLDPSFAKAYNNRGVVKADLGDKSGAITDFNRAITLDPTDAKAFYNRGETKVELGDKRGGILDFDRAITLAPDDANIYNNRGKIKYELEDRQGSILDFDRAIALNPDLAEAYGNRGIVKATLGDKSGGIADLSKAADLFRKQGRMDDYHLAKGFLGQINSELRIKN
jgi:tetratricopeptide (TPR) repeat protein